MSNPHPTISAWTREPHRGHYLAELHDWKLLVVWIPNTPTERGRFQWRAERDGERPRTSDHSFEEMEEAMAEAEQFARSDAARRTRAIATAVAGDH